jgi:integrase
MATYTFRGTDTQGKEVWYIRVFVDGKQKGFTFHGTHKQAEKEAAKLENAKDRGETISASKMKVGEYLQEWLATYQKPEVGKLTYHDQNLKVISHVIPFIGQKRMNALNPMDCQKVVNRLAVDQGKKRTAEITFNLMKKAFRKAVELGYLIKNPMDAVTKPKAKAEQRPFLTIEQAAIFLEYAQYDNLYPILAFLLLTGTRPEEAFGLKWTDINFENGTFAIVRSAKRIPGGGWEYSDLKTTTSRRNLDLSPTLTDILKSHKREQAKARLILNSEWIDNGLVFTNQVGNPTDIAVVRKHLAKVLEVAGLPKIRLYDLRHTHGSMLMSEGAAIKEISDRLGHANTSMTVNRYLHATPSRTKASVNRLDEALAEARRNKQDNKHSEKDVN